MKYENDGSKQKRGNAGGLSLRYLVFVSIYCCYLKKVMGKRKCGSLVFVCLRSHKHDVLTNSFSDLARRIKPLSICVNNNFCEHFRMVAIPAITRVSRSKNLVVEPIHSRINDTNEMVLGDVFLKI